MKILRLGLFIPSFFLALILGNVVLDLFFNLISFFNATDSEPLSFIWKDFLKSLFLSFIAISVGLMVYPFKNKLWPLIIFSLIYILIFIIVFDFYSTNMKFILNQTGDITIVNQISIVLGIIIGISYYWYLYFKGEVDFE
jgi:hypothetical protein